MRYFFTIMSIFIIGCSANPSLVDSDESLFKLRDELIQERVVPLGKIDGLSPSEDKFEELYRQAYELSQTDERREYYISALEVYKEEFEAVKYFCFSDKNIASEELKFILSINPLGKVRSVGFPSDVKIDVSCLAMSFMQGIDFPAHGFEVFELPIVQQLN